MISSTTEQPKPSTHQGLVMHWLPAPADFRGELRTALVDKEPADQLRKLAALARHRLGFLETLQLERALARIPIETETVFPRIRLALLGSSTVDHLIPGIRVAG